MTPAKMLVILVDESDILDDMPLYEAICRKLEQLSAPGATVQGGLMGFGSHGHLHRKRLFGVPDNKPVSIFIIDQEENLRDKIIPAIKPMVTEGLIYMTSVDIVD